MLSERRRSLFRAAGGYMDGLVVERYIPTLLYFDLIARTADYVNASMIAFGVDDPLLLPNRTHNGKLEPKREVLPLFNRIESLIAELTDAIFLKAPHSVRLPVNVRVKGRDVLNERGRPYATNKPHTDVWAGDPENSYVVIVPLIGDIECNGLRFGEPEGFVDKDAFRQQQSTYEEGMSTITGVRWYEDLRMRPQHAYLADSWCIHETVRSPDSLSDAFRVSIDYRVTFEEPSLARYSDLYLPCPDYRAARQTEAETIQDTVEKYGH